MGFKQLGEEERKLTKIPDFRKILKKITGSALRQGIETKIQALTRACKTWFRKPVAEKNLASLFAWDFTRLILKVTL